jgi:UDP-N-acetyl-D-glucosamine dehydrogenase
LNDRGAIVDYNDPYVARSAGHRDYPELNLRSVELTKKKIKSYDAVVIATDHSEYDYDWILKNAFLVVDTRNAIKKKRKKVVKA